MGLLDSILGRSRPVRPDLDQLFAVPSAALTLQAGTGFTPTGLGSVCFAGVEGGAFARVREDVRELLDADTGRGGVPVEFSQDAYGYTWLLARQEAGGEGTAALVNDLHAVNTLLQEGGFGPHLLCSLIGFRDPEGRALALVYLYKRGTFYPFAPARRAAGRGATTNGSSRYGRCSATTSGWRATSPAGSRCGAPPVSERVDPSTRDHFATDSRPDRNPSCPCPITLRTMPERTSPTDDALSASVDRGADRPVYVIGGGPGGLAVAAALREHGVRAVVLEKSDTSGRPGAATTTGCTSTRSGAGPRCRGWRCPGGSGAGCRVTTWCATWRSTPSTTSWTS